jgi:hypothetical protein
MGGSRLTFLGHEAGNRLGNAQLGRFGMNWLAKLMGNAGNDASPVQSGSAPASAPTLEQSIRSHFAPILREDGFAGSSRTFQRLANGMIQVVQVQGSRSGGSFAVNLGIHPTCIPVMGDPPQKKMKPELCILRRRLSEDGGDHWWKHSSAKESMDAAIKEAASVYADFGRPAFAKLVEPNSPLLNVTPQQFEAGRFDFSGFKSTDVMMAKALSLIRLAAGDSGGAQAFARIAIDRAGPAFGQLREMKAINQGTWRREDW